MAEFDDPNALVAATERAHHEGYRRMDAYSPFPIEELHKALGSRRTRLPLLVLIGGVFGCLRGLPLPYWGSAVAHSGHVRGRPPRRLAALHSLPLAMTTLPAGPFGRLRPVG